MTNFPFKLKTKSPSVHLLNLLCSLGLGIVEELQSQIYDMHLKKNLWADLILPLRQSSSSACPSLCQRPSEEWLIVFANHFAARMLLSWKELNIQVHSFRSKFSPSKGPSKLVLPPLFQPCLFLILPKVSLSFPSICHHLDSFLHTA